MEMVERLQLQIKVYREEIYKVFGVSKKKYKVALGSLYKNKRIVLEKDVVRAM